MAELQDLAAVLKKKNDIRTPDSTKLAERRAKGLGTAAERIALLLDEGSFVETDALLSDKGGAAGVITGSGTVDGRPVCVFAQDALVHGGAMGAAQAAKINKLLDLAAVTGSPVVCMCDSLGVRADEGARAMDAFSSVYARLAKLSGARPLICLVLGPVIGAAAMLAEICDITVISEKSGLLMAHGPTVIAAAQGKTLTAQDVGGASVMSAQGGVSLAAADERTAIGLCKRILGYLPSAFGEGTEVFDTDDLNREIQGAENMSAAQLMSAVADTDSVTELCAAFGPETHTALARMGGHACGIIASEPDVNDGMFTADAAAKAYRFVCLCDCFRLPVISLIDSRGAFVPDVKDQAKQIRALAALTETFAQSTTAKISVITGRAVGQSYIALAGKGFADITYAWPGAILSALDPDAAVQVLYSEKISAGEDRAKLEAEYISETAGALAAARDGVIDDIIAPAETRKYIIAALEMLACKDFTGEVLRRHQNTPV